MNPVRDFYNWEEFDADCDKISKWAKDKNFKNIYGIPRGGLILAVRISHLLGVPVILSSEDIGVGTLVVDDIVDGGNTLSRLIASFNFKVMTASLYIGPNPIIKPVFFMREKVDWVVFPWETQTSSRYDGIV